MSCAFRQLQHKKEFQPSSEVIPITNSLSGAKKLQEFEEIVADCNYNETLKAAGLSNEDIQLFLDYSKDKQLVLQKHKNYESSVLQKRISDIQSMIDDYKARQSNK